MQIKLNITTDDFKKLNLSRDTKTGDVSFELSAIKDVCEASNIDPELILSTEGNTSGFIVAWYDAHIKAGGDKDDLAEDLLLEVKIEDQHGSLSFKPGKA